MAQARSSELNSITKRLRSKLVESATTFTRSARVQPHLGATPRARTKKKKKEKKIERKYHQACLEAGMSPLLGICRPQIFCFEKRSGRFPISKGFTFLSVSQRGERQRNTVG